jgi:CRISPR-associated protein Cas1
MSVVYVDTQGSSIYRSKGTLLVKKEQEVLKEIPISQIDKLVLVGGIFISTSALNLILSNNIFTSFLSVDGKYKGSLFSGFSKNINLRIKQFEKYLDESFRNNIAKTLILNKIRNCYTFLLKYRRNHEDADFDTEIEKIKLIIKKLKNIREIKVANLLGIEGIAAKYYFSAYGKLIRKEFVFSKRTMYPPRDEINSLLSLGYTLLMNEFVSKIQSNGLDPFIGFLHGAEYGRESLAVDMIEEFRFLIDALVIKLINKKIIEKKDFEFDKEKQYFRLKDDKKKIFYIQYEKKLMTEIKVENMISLGNYHKIFSIQVMKLSKYIKDESESYTPFLYR